MSTSWKFDILTGKTPAKAYGYSNLIFRNDIISLYRKIKRITYASKVKPSELFPEFYKRKDIIDQLYSIVISSNTPVCIIYKTNTMLKFSIDTKYRYKRNGQKAMTYVIVKIPLIDDDLC